MTAALTIVGCGGNKSEQTQAQCESEDSLTGSFAVYELDGFRLHVYNTNDVMADASYIIEGGDSLVVMEYPLFRVNAAEFLHYISELAKPVAVSVTDYHLGGSAELPITMPEGMADFIAGPIYSGMMKHFASQFGDTMVDLPTQTANEVPFGTPLRWAGVDFRFEHGAASDFPAASIIIGNQVYYTHWTPAEAHPSALQIGSRDAVEAELAEAEKSLAAGAKYYIGGHGGLTERAQVEFKVEYLRKVKELLAGCADAASFTEALQQAYPTLQGDAAALAQALYAE